MFKRMVYMLVAILLLGLLGSRPLIAKTVTSFDVSGVILHESMPEGESPVAHIDGQTWHYYSHDPRDVEWAGVMVETCQSCYEVGIVPTRYNLCIEEKDGSHHWETWLTVSCNRACTTCPDIGDVSGCNELLCSSGWSGDISGCLVRGKEPQIAPPVRLPPVLLEDAP